MQAERQALLLFALGGWVALWWLAVRAVFGRRFGPFEWVWRTVTYARAQPMVRREAVAETPVAAAAVE